MSVEEPTATNLATKTEAAAVANIVRRHVKPELISLVDHESQVLVLPEGLSAHSLKPFRDAYLTAPERRKGTAVLGDLASFIAHTDRFADEDSALFASPDPKQPSLLAVLDYHEKSAEGMPRFGVHRGIYRFPLSDEWKLWNDRNAKSMDQRAFAEFVEDRLMDILGNPSDAGERARDFAETLQVTFAPASRLLELSRGMSVRATARVTNAVNLATGEVQVNYATSHDDDTAAGLVRVPGAFLIGIPVFRNGDGFQIPVRLRYRLVDGAIAWFYELHGADRVFEHAFREACDKAAAATGLPLFVGTPEN